VQRVRILFLDRDGTLNHSFGSRPPNRPEEVELLPGVASVLSEYAAQGWLIVIVSNQGGVASGYISEASARAVQQQVIELLPVPVAASYLCPHVAGGRVTEYALDCPNRKPRPGFILTALERFGACAEDCLFVGDASTDRLAAEAAGVPFCWADRFFGRPIDRGMQRPSGRWVQVCQAAPQEWTALGDLARSWSEDVPQPGTVEGADHLALVARDRTTPIGWLSLVRGESEGEADLAFGVDPAYHGLVGEAEEGTGIAALLLESALDWARAQPGLDRLCVHVRAEDLPVSRLCCGYGFVERRRPSRGRGAAGSVQLDCSL
jgi:histidinol-phosphate phosphatase family protein